MMSASLPFLFSIIFNLATISFVGWLLFFKRELSFFVRPSIVFVAFLYCVYLLPSQLLNEHIKRMSPFIDNAVLLLSAVIFFSLCAIYWFYKKTENNSPKISSQFSEKYKSVVLLGLVGSLITCVTLYFSQISFMHTGLYSLLCDPKHFVILREMSLKLAGIQWLGYVYLIGFSCVCPFLCVLWVDKILNAKGRNIVALLVFGMPLLLFVLFYLLITGARVGILNCALAVLGALWYRLSFKKFLPAAVLTIVGALSLAALISMAWVNRIDDSEANRGGICSLFAVNNYELKQLDADSPVSWTTQRTDGFLSYFEGIINRIFIVPAAISGWYVEEGIYSGARPYYLYSPESKKMANVFAQKYVKRIYGEEYQAGESIMAPTSFVFVNFIYFGYWSILMSVLGILAMDFAFILAGTLGRVLSVPFMAMCLYYSFIFAQTGYATVILSHGYFLLVGIVIVLYCLNRWIWQRQTTDC
ncbi:hypothetical protein [Bdellovibrio sp. BCCA]|uniref:hypothetical protein n=1 Tax=Bdellovibrio sp. BCCA TaxID=3136281 RepID=UPI0030F2B063